MWKKKELETVFRLFWNNINQLMMDHQQANTSLNIIYAKGLKRFAAQMIKYCQPVLHPLN